MVKPDAVVLDLAAEIDDLAGWRLDIGGESFGLDKETQESIARLQSHPRCSTTRSIGTARAQSRSPASIIVPFLDTPVYWTARTRNPDRQDASRRRALPFRKGRESNLVRRILFGSVKPFPAVSTNKRELVKYLFMRLISIQA
jgi:hypothetical protein